MQNTIPVPALPPPNLGITTTTTTPVSDGIHKPPSLKPTQTKVTTLADLGYVDDKPTPSNKLGFNEDEDPTEYFDLPDVFRSKVEEVAELIKKAKRVVVYTGAGISTGPGADLPDYRGTEGVWTLRDKGLKPKKTLAGIETALPTYGHMAIVALLKSGHFHYVVSTNVDGLHMRSGVPEDQLAELHGNSYLERCSLCKKPYFRDFDVTNTLVDHYSTHRTGRTCDVEGCGGELLDSIIHFGENLPTVDVKNADKQSKMADVALVLGTSLRVSPANQFPVSVQRRNLGHLIICNLQITPFDKYAKNISRGYTDDFLYHLAKCLGVSVDLALPINPCSKNTGEVLHAPEYLDVMDQLYTDKQEVWKKQQEEFLKKCKEYKKQQLSKVISVAAGGGGLKRNRTIIEKQNGESQTISLSRPSDMLMFSRCTDCKFILKGAPVAKLIIENCNSTTIEVHTTVLTSMLEIIGCQDLTIVTWVPLLTVSVDRTDTVHLNFEGHETFKMIVSCQVEGLLVSANGKEHRASISSLIAADGAADQDLAVLQFITSWVNGEIVTDKVVREGEGGTLITTERESTEFAEKQRLNDAAMENYVRGMFKITERGEKKDEK